VLERLRQYKLYTKLSKCEFSIILVIFFGFVINTGEIKININRIKVIAEWLEPKFFKNVQIFLNFANFYHHFIKNYSRIAAPLISIFKDSVNDRKTDSFEFTKKEKAAFELLKIFFIRAPILIHFKSNRPIKIKMDILNFTITGILS
jgi:hypothetical protein